MVTTLDCTEPAQRAAAIESDVEIVRFMQHFGCEHLKLNISGEQPRKPPGLAFFIFRQNQ
jgi:hypothetical protein